MHEIIPVAAGVALGVALARVPSPRLRFALLAVLGVVTGVVISAALGELASGFFYAIWDVAQVVACAAGTLALGAVVRRHPVQRG